MSEHVAMSNKTLLGDSCVTAILLNLVSVNSVLYLELTSHLEKKVEDDTHLTFEIRGPGCSLLRPVCSYLSHTPAEASTTLY